jgi:hypothetical protein
MQRTAVFQRIDRMRFEVGPNRNQLTAIGNAVRCNAAYRSWGVEAAAAAPTHAGRRTGESKTVGQISRSVAQAKYAHPK